MLTTTLVARKEYTPTDPRQEHWAGGKDKSEYVTGGKEHVYLAVNSLNIINSRGIYNLK